MRKRKRMYITIFTVIMLVFSSIQVGADISSDISDDIREYLKLKYNINGPIDDSNLWMIHQLHSSFMYQEYNNNTFTYEYRVHEINDFRGFDQLTFIQQLFLHFDKNAVISEVDIAKLVNLEIISFMIGKRVESSDDTLDDIMLRYYEDVSALVADADKDQKIKDGIVKYLKVLDNVSNKNDYLVVFLDLPFYDYSFLSEVNTEHVTPEFIFSSNRWLKTLQPDFETIFEDGQLRYRYVFDNPNIFVYSKSYDDIVVDWLKAYQESRFSVNPSHDPKVDAMIDKVSYKNLAGEILIYDPQDGQISFETLYVYVNEDPEISNDGPLPLLEVSTRSTRPIYEDVGEISEYLADSYFIHAGGKSIRYRVDFETLTDEIIDAYVGLKSYTKINHPRSIVRNNYVFKGWYKDQAYNDAWDFDEDRVTENIVLYAKWENNPKPISPKEPTIPKEPIKPDKPLDKTIQTDPSPNKKVLPDTGIHPEKIRNPLLLILLGLILGFYALIKNRKNSTSL